MIIAPTPNCWAKPNHVDACTMWFVKQPEYCDVIVTENLFGDIITDLAAIISDAENTRSK